MTPTHTEVLAQFDRWVSNAFDGGSSLGMTQERQLITVRRSGALGDVLAASCVATYLAELGQDVRWQSSKACHPILRRLKSVKQIAEPTEPPDVNLDGAYEEHPDRTTRHFADLFVERANEHLDKLHIRIDDVVNFAPRMTSDPHFVKLALRDMKRHPKPWVTVCPRSQSWVNRTVPNEIWQEAAPHIQGTKFWLGVGPEKAPKGFVDLHCREVDMLIEYIGQSDLLVSVDSGPGHIACSLGVPLIVIQQQSDPANHYSNQRDFLVISPPLDCLNCCKERCPIDADKPPCQQIDPLVIAHAANDRLRATTTDDISAVVVIYKPKVEKLNRCLEALLPQVSEIVVVADNDTPYPLVGMFTDRKLRCLRISAHETGYGRKATYGARHTNGRYIWFCNDDLYPDADVGEKLLTLLKSDDQIAIVDHLLRYPNLTLQFAGLGRPHGAVGFGHIDHRKMKCRYLTPVEQESCCAASMIVRRNVFFEVDGFDENYLVYSEDADLGMKVRHAGYKIMFTPHAEGIHEEHQSAKLRPNIESIRRDSAELFARKWRDFFRSNPDVSKIGNFNYETK
jgi:GT2 family glycosyltransferase